MNGHAVCPFCERQVVYGGVEFGEYSLHDECYAELQKGMAEDPVVIEFTPLQENNENGGRPEEVDG
jgi:hypothetical protein